MIQCTNALEFGDWLDLWHSVRQSVFWFLAVAILLIVLILIKYEGNSTHSLASPASSSEKALETPSEKSLPEYGSSFPSNVANNVVNNAANNVVNSEKIVHSEDKPEKSRIPKTKKVPRRFVADKGSLQPKSTVQKSRSEVNVVIFFSTITGSTEKLASKVHKKIEDFTNIKPELVNIDYIPNLDDYFVSPKNNDTVYIIIIPSYETESPLDYFIQTLKETYNDFRIDSKPLRDIVGFTVFGVGDSEGWPQSSKKFCYQAVEVDRYMGKLGARRIAPLGTGCVKSNLDSSVTNWLETLDQSLLDSNSPAYAYADEDSDGDDSTMPANEPTASLADVEDIGSIIKSSIADSDSKVEAIKKEMVAKETPTFKALTKQGYTIVGSHSGVKICRWTKSALRGRGSCYKYSFYGIKSHLCMETTPSLSCSNKCVFCWRHGTNPVGTTWRWQVDEPEFILKGALEGHYKKINQMKGVPGVIADRFTEAFQVKHCALSLVGEPIFYPHINKFLSLLHERNISSFLVCNAQHPTELAALERVTQLYVSIDASNKEALRNIDRPLHRDFWERLEKCLDILRTKASQRTVFRLTLVGGFNMDDCAGYADLVARGLPCFIEIKGVTYCGTSKDNPLTMKNVPFYEEVKTFAENLNKELSARGFDYGIAAEHAHSCCILLAQSRFNINGAWHTKIDYERFFTLLNSGEDFGPMDYIAPTSEWALYESDAHGFNPEDTRVVRKKLPVSSVDSV